MALGMQRTPYLFSPESYDPITDSCGDLVRILDESWR